MPELLIVCPAFPPLNSADMHRVRLMLPHLTQSGWKARVLACRPHPSDGVWDPLLLKTVPDGVPVVRARTFPPAVSRLAGIGNLGIRSLPFLHREAVRLIRRRKPDLIFFSTTSFLVMTLGPIWKMRFGVPFVLDFQDLWANTYHEPVAGWRAAAKRWLARKVHGFLEPRVVPRSDGLVAVSSRYLETLVDRYPALNDVPTRVLPFGAAETDFQFLSNHPRKNRVFRPGDGHLHGVYVGRGGPDMRSALDALFGGLRGGVERRMPGLSRLRLHFVGTDYAAGRPRCSILPVAERWGVAGQVTEHPGRVPYFEALQLLRDADFLIVPGSDDRGYSASKLYPVVLARKPTLFLLCQGSPLEGLVERLRCGRTVRFSPDTPDERTADQVAETLASMMGGGFSRPETDWGAFGDYDPQRMTTRLCALFERVLENSPSLGRGCGDSPVGDVGWHAS